MKKFDKIIVNSSEISMFRIDGSTYISLSDIAKYRDPDRSDYIIQNWLRNKSTIEFIGLWEKLHNTSFNSIEFDGIKNSAGSNSFVLTPKRWIESTNAIGIISKTGRYGGTFAHEDIAFEFASWISPEFKLYLIVEFQRLKREESESLNLEWNLSRMLSKINYHIHTSAVKERLIPPILSKNEQNYIYCSEADLLNLCLFGLTAKEWRDKNPEKTGNIRDYASIEQLIVLTNLESLNSILIKEGVDTLSRMKTLNKTAIEQMRVLVNIKASQKLFLKS